MCLPLAWNSLIGAWRPQQTEVSTFAVDVLAAFGWARKAAGNGSDAIIANAAAQTLVLMIGSVSPSKQ